MGKYKPSSTLLYGDAGAGKTALGISSFWDWKAQALVAKGKFITFGGEDNPALNIPEECRELRGPNGERLSLRLTSPSLDSPRFLHEFRTIMNTLLAAAVNGVTLDSLVIDSVTELDLLFEATYARDESNNFEMWNALLAEFFAIMMRCNYDALKCAVIMTARVMERRKAGQTKKGATAGDPTFQDFNYYPSLRGSFRHQLPHYFNNVWYMQTGSATYQDRIVPVHIVNMYRTGDFYVKNHWEHLWLAAGKPAQVLNPMWVKLWGDLTGVMGTTQTTESGDSATYEDVSQ